MGDPGYAVIDAMIASLHKLDKALVVDARPALAKIMREDVEATISAQTDAYGEPWKGARDGGPMLEGADGNLKVIVRGTKIVMSLNGYHARHHRGFAQGGTKRAILPTQGLIPPKTALRMRRELEKRFAAAMKGGT